VEEGNAVSGEKTSRLLGTVSCRSALPLTLPALAASTHEGTDVRRRSRRVKPTANFRRGNSADLAALAGSAAGDVDEAARPIVVIAPERFHRTERA